MLGHQIVTVRTKASFHSFWDDNIQLMCGATTVINGTSAMQILSTCIVNNFNVYVGLVKP